MSPQKYFRYTNNNKRMTELTLYTKVAITHFNEFKNIDLSTAGSGVYFQHEKKMYNKHLEIFYV